MNKKIKLAMLSLGLTFCMSSKSNSAPNLSPSYVYIPLFGNETLCPKNYCREPDNGWTFKNFCERYDRLGSNFITVARTQYQGAMCSCPCSYDYLND